MRWRSEVSRPYAFIARGSASCCSERLGSVQVDGICRQSRRLERRADDHAVGDRKELPDVGCRSAGADEERLVGDRVTGVAQCRDRWRTARGGAGDDDGVGQAAACQLFGRMLERRARRRDCVLDEHVRQDPCVGSDRAAEPDDLGGVPDDEPLIGPHAPRQER